MNRRDFLQYAALLASLPKSKALWASDVKPVTDTKPEIAFTFDDPKTDELAGLSWQEINRRMLDALARHRIKATLFVTGKRVNSDDGRHLIAEWDRAGHQIANHSYSHLFFNDDEVSLAQFKDDFLKNEPLIRDYAHFTRLFRFPFFKEGDTREKRDGMRAFLQQHGYRIGRATIDASDWAISERLEKRRSTDPKADAAPYGEFLKQHIWERAQFYDLLTRRVLKHEVRHTVLLHHTPLNALFLDQLIDMFVAKGWKPVDSEYAFADPVYDLQPDILPAGEGLIWALAKQSGKFEKELRYPGEDDTYENPKMDALRL